MANVVKVQVGIATSAGVFEGEMSPRVTRFEFDDGKDSFIMSDAFPSDEVMINDCQNKDHFVYQIISRDRGGETDEREIASTVSSWETLWTK